MEGSLTFLDDLGGTLDDFGVTLDNLGVTFGGYCGREPFLGGTTTHLDLDLVLGVTPDWAV